MCVCVCENSSIPRFFFLFLLRFRLPFWRLRWFDGGSSDRGLSFRVNEDALFALQQERNKIKELIQDIVCRKESNTKWYVNQEMYTLLCVWKKIVNTRLITLVLRTIWE